MDISKLKSQFAEQQKIVDEAKNALEASKAFMPNAMIQPIRHQPLTLPRIPTQEEVNEYQSAGSLIRILADEAKEWVESYEGCEEFVPAVVAILQNGIQVQVHSVEQVTFHGIRVTGTSDIGPCSLFCHQSTFQMLCVAIPKKEDEPRRPIGFIWDGQRLDV